MENNRNAWLNRLIEAATGPMIAILFWLMVVLLAIFAIAHGKLLEANIFEAIGSVGQVGFAAAVFWLGYLQFDFNKQASQRQHKIDTYPLRIAVLESYRDLKPEFYLKRFGPSVPPRFSILSREIDALFSPPTRALSEKLCDALFELDSIIEEIEDAKTHEDVETETVLRTRRMPINKQIALLSGQLLTAMRSDLRIEA